tara:strand:+ start:150 stop:344 length:195 start_codon:yes stop_codon:yes gene_type:complete
LAAATGWGYTEIMEEVPISAGMQIIDAELLTKGIIRHRWADETPDFDSRSMVEDAFTNLKNGKK